MRLIDANGSYTLNASDNTGYSLGFGGGIISVADEYGHIVAEFFADDAPTIEAEPVKHGEWIPDDKFPSGKSSIFHCSECYYSRTTSVLYTAEKLSQDDPYCKKCGAKMDGGAEDA